MIKEQEEYHSSKMNDMKLGETAAINDNKTPVKRTTLLVLCVFKIFIFNCVCVCVCVCLFFLCLFFSLFAVFEK